MTENRSGHDRRTINVDCESKHRQMKLDIEENIKAIANSVSASKAWMIGTLISIIGALLMTAAYLITQGGFAKASDLAEVKTNIAVITNTLAAHQKMSDENNEILRRLEKNGRHK